MNLIHMQVLSFARLAVLCALLFCGKTAETAMPHVITVSVPNGGHPMAAKTDSHGTIHLIFDSASGPQYCKSVDNGKTLSTPIPIVDPGSQKPGLEFITWDMAVSAEGAVHVALGNNAWKLKLPKDEWGFFYARLLPGETSFPPLRNINHKPSEGFSIAVRGSGDVTAVWMADKLFANVSHDGGKTFGSIKELDPSLDPCNCCTTSSVYAADGRVAILYREETDNDRDIYLALWNQTTNKAVKTRVSKTPWNVDACPMTYFSVTSSVDGFLAAWPTKGQIYFARLDPSGKPRSPEEIKTLGANGMRTGIMALTTFDGGALVAWKKDKQLGWQLYDKQGQPAGKAGSINCEGNGVAAVIAKNGDVVLFQ